LRNGLDFGWRLLVSWTNAIGRILVQLLRGTLMKHVWQPEQTLLPIEMEGEAKPQLHRCNYRAVVHGN
jgi:hypothetical protein